MCDCRAGLQDPALLPLDMPPRSETDEGMGTCIGWPPDLYAAGRDVVTGKVVPGYAPTPEPLPETQPLLSPPYATWQPYAGRMLLTLTPRETAEHLPRLVAAAAGGELRALVLLRVATDQEWFALAARWPRCYLRGRLRFPGYRNAAPYASMVLCLGAPVSCFQAVFGPLGVLEGIPQATDGDVETRVTPDPESLWRRLVRKMFGWVS
jgi:hypothetical protein